MVVPDHPIFYLISALIVIVMQIIKGESGDIVSMIFFILYSGAGVFLITEFIAFRVSRKYMGFVWLAEGIFERFGWRNSENIDLPAITKKNKKPGAGSLGYLFFRYCDDMADRAS
ncbi:hypothetical protein [Burkholderia territorii]|uniref:hypothetical protein n=1 Tax=Burkholderia territorii TaxID=1503055 RepID=UPI000751D4CD|nr:hypothetical protein WT37_03695 [Burkholderia territorii]